MAVRNAPKSNFDRQFEVAFASVRLGTVLSRKDIFHLSPPSFQSTPSSSRKQASALPFYRLNFTASRVTLPSNGLCFRRKFSHHLAPIHSRLLNFLLCTTILSEVAQGLSTKKLFLCSSFASFNFSISNPILLIATEGVFPASRHGNQQD